MSADMGQNLARASGFLKKNYVPNQSRLTALKQRQAQMRGQVNQAPNIRPKKRFNIPPKIIF